jgi:hypothetical protein
MFSGGRLTRPEPYEVKAPAAILKHFPLHSPPLPKTLTGAKSGGFYQLTSQDSEIPRYFLNIRIMTQASWTGTPISSDASTSMAVQVEVQVAIYYSAVSAHVEVSTTAR